MEFEELPQHKDEGPEYYIERSCPDTGATAMSKWGKCHNPRPSQMHRKTQPYICIYIYQGQVDKRPFVILRGHYQILLKYISYHLIYPPVSFEVAPQSKKAIIH